MSHFSYPKIANMLIQFLEQTVTEKEIYLEQETFYQEQIQLIQDNLKKEIDEWKTKYTNLQSSFNEKVAKDVSQYLEKNKNNEKQIKELKELNQQLQNNFNDLNKQYNAIFNQKYEAKESQDQFKEMEIRYKSQIKDYEELQGQYNKIYESYKEHHINQTAYQEKILILENNNKILLQQKNQLQNDLMSYQKNYTPRPNLNKILLELSLEDEYCFQEKKQKCTSEYVEQIENKVKEMNKNLNENIKKMEKILQKDQSKKEFEGGKKNSILDLPNNQGGKNESGLQKFVINNSKSSQQQLQQNQQAQQKSKSNASANNNNQNKQNIYQNQQNNNQFSITGNKKLLKNNISKASLNPDKSKDHLNTDYMNQYDDLNNWLVVDDEENEFFDIKTYDGGKRNKTISVGEDLTNNNQQKQNINKEIEKKINQHQDFLKYVSNQKSKINKSQENLNESELN